MTNEEAVNQLLAELSAGETLDNIIIKAINQGREYGYQKGWHVGFMQAREEAEWTSNGAQS